MRASRQAIRRLLRARPCGPTPRSPVQAGVDTTNNYISLDLAQAGQNVNLPPGKYWLVVHARTSTANRWVWWGVEHRQWLVHVDQAEHGRLDFEQQFARPCPSESAAKSVAARPGSAPRRRRWGSWLHDKSAGVQVQLGTSALAAGSHGGYLCLTSNDPERPKVAARIGVTVKP